MLSSINLRYALAALAIGSFLIIPASADIVDIQVAGTVNGSSSLLITCCVPDGVLNGGGFQINDTNGQIGTFTRSAQGSADGSNDRVLAASGLEQQITEVTSHSLTVNLVSDFTVFPVEGGEWSASASLNNDYHVAFTLTTESLMHLTSQVNSSSVFFPFLNLGVGDTAITGPPPPDLTLIVPAGQYTFELFAGGDVQHGPGGLFNPQTDDFVNFTLSADFTPVVPEPRWICMGLALAGIAARTWRSRVPGG